MQRAHTEITKTFTFDAGHRLSNYEGKCRRLHGHTYHVEITVNGILDTLGMVMDFGILKDIFKEEVDAKFDHKMMLYENDELNKKIAGALPDGDDSICWVGYNPTAENIATDIFSIIAKRLPDGVQLTRVRLYETPTSFAEVVLKN